MGIKVATNVFQQTLGYLFADILNVWIYINDYITISHRIFKKYMEDIVEILRKLQDSRIQINATKYKEAI